VSVTLRHIRRIACEQSYTVCDAEAYAHKREFGMENGLFAVIPDIFA